MKATEALAVETLGERRRAKLIKILAYASGSLILAGLVVVAISHPVPVIGALFALFAVTAIVLYPIPALILLLFLIPFHTTIILALNNRAHLATGPLDYWKDILIVGLFLRGASGHIREHKTWRISRSFGDNYLLLYVFLYSMIAIGSPAGPAVIRALSRDVEGPLLLLAIVLLKPKRREIWYCVAALLSAATIIGFAALYEKLGPHQGFLTWYGAVPPARDSSFFAGGGYRAGSFLDSPLVLAFFLAGALPLAVALATIRSRLSILSFVAVAACGTGLFVAITRSGYIGGGVGTLFALGLAVRNMGVRVALIGLVIVLGGGIAAYNVSQGNQTFLRSGGNTAHRQALQRDLALIEAKPLGYGLGTTDSLATRFAIPTKGSTESTIMAKTLEAGLPGLALYAIAIFVTLMRLRAAWLRSLREQDLQVVALSAGAIGAMLGVVLAGLFLGVQELVIEIVLWATPGLALAASLSLERTETRPPLHMLPSAGDR